MGKTTRKKYTPEFKAKTSRTGEEPCDHVEKKLVRRLMNLMDLYTIIDVYSRYIVGWGLYNSLDASNAIEVLDAAVRKHGAPEIINSDQGIDHQIPAARYAAAIAA